MRIVVYFTLGLLWSGGILADHSSYPKISINDDTDDSFEISYEYYEVPIMKQVKSILGPYKKVIMIGWKILLVGFIAFSILFLALGKSETYPIIANFLHLINLFIYHVV